MLHLRYITLMEHYQNMRYKQNNPTIAFSEWGPCSATSFLYCGMHLLFVDVIPSKCCAAPLEPLLAAL
jgi:hypothetical protein